jgi:hypothetical protein
MIRYDKNGKPLELVNEPEVKKDTSVKITIKKGVVHTN